MNHERILIVEDEKITALEISERHLGLVESIREISGQQVSWHPHLPLR